jgi:hypothetical protein
MLSVVRTTTGNRDQRQRDGAGIAREVLAAHVQRVHEQADHDRRRRQHDVGDEAGHLRELVVLAVFGQVDAGQDADRGADPAVDRPTISRLPTMALRRPPPSLPGAGVSTVNSVATARRSR